MEYGKQQDVAAQVAAYEKAARERKAAFESVRASTRPALAETPINWPRLRQIFVRRNFTRDEIEEFEQDDLVDLCELIQHKDRLILNQFGKEHAHRYPAAGGRRERQPAELEPYSESEWFTTKHSGYSLPDAQELYFYLKN